MYAYYAHYGNNIVVTNDDDIRIATVDYDEPYHKGFMTYANDTDGLHNYLINQKILKPTDILCFMY